MMVDRGVDGERNSLKIPLQKFRSLFLLPKSFAGTAFRTNLFLSGTGGQLVFDKVDSDRADDNNADDYFLKIIFP